MNPQKLAGQCAKLKCCLNFEIDAYAESSSKLPPKDVTLETVDGTYYYFKPDILAGKVTYSTDKSVPANLVTLDLRRIHEIISLNKQGIKVESLEASEAENKPKEYVDLVEQESLTRFDNSRKKKKKKKPARDKEQVRDKEPARDKEKDSSAEKRSRRPAPTSKGNNKENGQKTKDGKRNQNNHRPSRPQPPTES